MRSTGRSSPASTRCSRGRSSSSTSATSHGVYTYHANRVLENADIISIEADPRRFAVLQENAKKWLEGSSNTITCINAAASDADDAKTLEGIEFFVTDTQISGGLFSVPERSDDYKPTVVPVVQVDDLYRAGIPTMVKIDVEGGELRVLQGAEKLVDSGTTQFLTEVSWWGDRGGGTSSFDVLRFCYSHGLRRPPLRSDYLMKPEAGSAARAWSIARCVPPLLVRTIWNKFVPMRFRKMRERRLNARRLAPSMPRRSHPRR